MIICPICDTKCAVNGIMFKTESNLHLEFQFCENCRCFIELSKWEPQLPRDWWVNNYDHHEPVWHTSKEEAEAEAEADRSECIHVREIL